MTVHLSRHGRTEGNAAGRTDPPPGEKGRERARTLAEWAGAASPTRRTPGSRDRLERPE